MKHCCAAAFLLLLPAQAAVGQTDNQPEKFSCDAPGGAFSRYQRMIGSNAVNLTAKVQVNQLRGTGEWRPVVNVMLNAGGNGNRVGFRLLPDRDRKKTTVFVAFPGTKGGEELAVGEADMNAQFALAVNVDANGTRLSVNGMTKSGPSVPGANWTLDLSCSSVDAHIDEIAIQRG